jgi:hypothetical protein
VPVAGITLAGAPDVSPAQVVCVAISAAAANAKANASLNTI